VARGRGPASRKVRVAFLEGSYFLATGVWPLVSRRTFERVTGPKVDFWLARTVGVLVGSVGAALLIGGRRRRVDVELEFLGATSAVGLATIDVIFSARGTISKIYLFDAAIEGAFVVAWIRSRAGS
jgi:hypothetical protein